MTFSVKLMILVQIFCVCHGFRHQNRKIREEKAINNRPIIGVMVQSTCHVQPLKSLGQNYIAASYVKYLEASGARVVPIRNDLTESETEKLFYSINGVLFPGGDVDVVNSSYAKVGKIILNLAKKSFDKGDYFPVWGICLGHEFLSTYVAGTKDILSQTDSQNITMTLNFTGCYKDSQIFHDLSIELQTFLSNVPSTSNFHSWSVTVTSFNNNEKMKEFFNIVTTNMDRKGIEFVSTMEGKHYPFFATQWHPEKNPFEWTPKRNMSHVAKAIETTQYLSNFFVNEARSSMHKFDSEMEEEAALIYNYTPLYTGGVSFFEQCYFFNNCA